MENPKNVKVVNVPIRETGTAIKGISVAGAITHNVAQLSVASLILGESVLLYYLPVLMVSAVVTGLITGFISELTVEKIKERGLFKEWTLN